MIADHLSSKFCLDGAYTDQSKAFNYIKYKKLLIKLETEECKCLC